MAQNKITRHDLSRVVPNKKHLHLAMMKVSRKDLLIVGSERMGLPCAFKRTVLDELPHERKERLLYYSHV